MQAQKQAALIRWDQIRRRQVARQFERDNLAYGWRDIGDPGA